MAGFGNKGRADQLGKNHGNGVIEKLHGIELTVADKSTDGIQIWQMVLRQVLNLDQSASITPSAVGTIELNETSGSYLLTGLVERIFRALRSLCSHSAWAAEPSAAASEDLSANSRSRLAEGLQFIQR